MFGGGYFGQGYFGGVPRTATGGHTGSGTVGVAYALTGVGSKKATSAGTVGVAFALGGSGRKVAAAAGTVVVAFALGGTGSQLAAHTGTGTLGVSHALTGTARKISAGSGTLGIAHTLGGSGRKIAVKTGTLGVTYALSGSTSVVYHHTILTGQSLAQGTAPPLSGASTNPLVETLDASGHPIALTSPTVQAPERTLADTAQPLAGTGYHFTINTHAAGGETYAQLRVSTYPGSISRVQTAWTYLTGLGNSLIVRALHIIHGESDRANGITQAAYLADLQEWINDYNTDVAAITGQSERFPAIIDQLSSTPGGSPGDVNSVPLAQLQAHRLNTDFALVGPKYQLATTDGVHLTNVSNYYLGELHARVHNREVLQAGRWEPVHPRSVIRVANVIDVKFNVPAPPLVFDTTVVSAQTNMGFQYVDDSSSATISSVAIVGNDTVRITLNTTPTGTGQTVKYGANAFRKGNLRDSETAVSAYDGTTLPNWAVMFADPVGYGIPTGTGTLTVSHTLGGTGRKVTARAGTVGVSYRLTGTGSQVTASTPGRMTLTTSRPGMTLRDNPTGHMTLGNG